MEGLWGKVRTIKQNVIPFSIINQRSSAVQYQEIKKKMNEEKGISPE